MPPRTNTQLAVLSDIHGNIRALDAVLADIEIRGIRSIVNLGDCAYGPFDPAPAMERLLQPGIPTVSGNEDRILVEATEGISHSRTATSCAKMLDRSHIEWLANLPLTLHVHEAFLFHGLPEDDTRYLLTAVDERGAQPRSSGDIERLLATYGHPLMLCGHDHTPRILELSTEQVIVNPGSVGCPAYVDDNPHDHVVENGSPHARYAVVELQDNRVYAELVEVTYDWEAAAEEARVNDFPDWAHWIKTGRAA